MQRQDWRCIRRATRSTLKQSPRCTNLVAGCSKRDRRITLSILRVNSLCFRGNPIYKRPCDLLAGKTLRRCPQSLRMLNIFGKCDYLSNAKMKRNERGTYTFDGSTTERTRGWIAYST